MKLAGAVLLLPLAACLGGDIGVSKAQGRSEVWSDVHDYLETEVRVLPDYSTTPEPVRERIDHLSETAGANATAEKVEAVVGVAGQAANAIAAVPHPYAKAAGNGLKLLLALIGLFAASKQRL